MHKSNEQKQERTK